MKDFEDDVVNKPKPFKPEITYWGCGVKEGESKFMDCPKCIELKLMKRGNKKY